MMADGRKAVRLRIRGSVQGVGYRAWCQQGAFQRGLSGWVRNRQDATVEALLVGGAAAIDEMITACRQGPPGASVDSVEASPAQV
jgi:acylphosphatase